MKNVPQTENIWVSLGFMVCSIVVEKIIDYVFEEIKES